MNVSGKHIGFGITGSHCTYEEVIGPMQALVDAGAKVTPFVSPTFMTTDTKFGTSSSWQEEIKRITPEPLVDSIVKAEPFGPKTPLDCMLIAPLTGNSMSKFANAMTDTPVLMGAKATLRTGRPVVLAISTNDGLGLNGINVMRLINAKNIYFVPFGQDAPFNKPTSLVAHMELIMTTIEHALDHKQIQPILRQKVNS
ncbi:dipicolinate synthase subunit B [Paenalkalicoccus suaedae]|uniref:Dipicolinate synthase subunit B n=1 Tax=Paenalkalicoccus suaedae TaxID=2592382 RepID=A0A859FFK1_9BACI|nr:dipicolinate synthase subunit B [Paenalkalicoccus suaedae]QKS71384.1 dipicolinate synthase subunit B [Paenalkalicoccus suaedae]